MRKVLVGVLGFLMLALSTFSLEAEEKSVRVSIVLHDSPNLGAVCWILEDHSLGLESFNGAAVLVFKDNYGTVRLTGTIRYVLVDSSDSDFVDRVIRNLGLSDPGRCEYVKKEKNDR